MRKSISIIIISIFLLSACANQVGVDSTATPAPARTSTIVRFTRTPGMVPSRTPKPQEPTDQPTHTPRRNTPEPTPTIPPATVIAQATLDSLTVNFPELKDYFWSGSISPSGRWASLSNLRILRLMEVNGSRKWDITYFDHNNIYVCRPDCGDHVGIVGVDHWSKDDTHIYLIPYPEWDGPGLWFGTGGSTLIRFNLIDGSWTDMNLGWVWSFSSDERYLIYTEEDGIRVRTLLYDSEYLIPIPEKFETLGKFVWSPDNEKFVFTATHGEWTNEEIGFSSFVFDTTDLSLRLLFEDDIRYLYPVEWSEKDRIVFCQYDMGWLHVSIPDPGCFYFDLNTNEITRIPDRQH